MLPRDRLCPLTVIRRIDEISAIVVEKVEHLEGSLLGTFAHGFLPILPKVHRAET